MRRKISEELPGAFCELTGHDRARHPRAGRLLCAGVSKAIRGMRAVCMCVGVRVYNHLAFQVACNSQCVCVCVCVWTPSEGVSLSSAGGQPPSAVGCPMKRTEPRTDMISGPGVMHFYFANRFEA